MGPVAHLNVYAWKEGPRRCPYRTQASYRAAVNAAWSVWGQRSFRVQKTFPAAPHLGQPVTVTFRVPYSVLSVSVQRAAQLAF